MDAIGQENSESLQELLENLPLLEQMNQVSGPTQISTPQNVSVEYAQDQICELAGVRPYLLRFWESEFEEIHPQIREDGQKIYSEEDLLTIRRVKELLLDEKLTIERARHLLRKERAQSSTNVMEDDISNEIASIPELPLETQMMQDTVEEVDEERDEAGDEERDEAGLAEIDKQLTFEMSDNQNEEVAELAALSFSEFNIENQQQLANEVGGAIDPTQPALEVASTEEDKLVSEVALSTQSTEINEMVTDRGTVADLTAKDKSIAKTAFVTRFQKNEVGPGPAGVQLAQDLAIARAQFQQQGLIQSIPQVDTLMEKREQLVQIKNKLEGLILELKLKRSSTSCQY